MSSFRRAPRVAIATIGTRAICIGATTPVFSLFHSAVMLPLPSADPKCIVRIWEKQRAQGIEAGTVESGTIVRLSKRARLLERIAPRDAATFALPAALLFTAGFVSAALPPRCAISLDPLQSLRAE